MKGRYVLKVSDTFVSYEIVLERQITILKGDSGIGKSTFVNLCENVEVGRAGTYCNLADKIYVLHPTREGLDILSAYSSVHDSIFVCDENTYALFRSEDFARFVKNNDNYFIIVSRSGILDMLSYSVDSIYTLELSNNGKMHKLENVYKNTRQFLAPDLVITEDSNSGFQFFSNALSCKVLSAGGKSNIWQKAKDNAELGKIIYCIVDGASFGADIARIVSQPKQWGIYIFAPESFEWLLLHIKEYGVSKELAETYNYCDTKDYISWEEYYFKLLVELGKSLGIPYKKEKLNKVFLRHINEIKPLIEDLADSVWK